MTAANVESPVELWKDIPGYEGLYQVSDLGNVKSLKRTFTSGRFGRLVQTYPEQLLTLRKNKSGYCYVGLSRDGVVKKYKVHRLVALCFKPNAESKPHVDHINTVRDDNRAVNLQWVYPWENMSNALSKPRQRAAKMGSKNPMAKKTKPVNQCDKSGKVVATFSGVNEAARQLGFDSSCITRCCHRPHYTYKGFTWRYVENQVQVPA